MGVRQNSTYPHALQHGQGGHSQSGVGRHHEVDSHGHQLHSAGEWAWARAARHRPHVPASQAGGTTTNTTTTTTTTTTIRATLPSYTGH